MGRRKAASGQRKKCQRTGLESNRRVCKKKYSHRSNADRLQYLRECTRRKDFQARAFERKRGWTCYHGGKGAGLNVEEILERGNALPGRVGSEGAQTIGRT